MKRSECLFSKRCSVQPSARGYVKRSILRPPTSNKLPKDVYLSLLLSPSQSQYYNTHPTPLFWWRLIRRSTLCVCVNFTDDWKYRMWCVCVSTQSRNQQSSITEFDIYFLLLFISDGLRIFFSSWKSIANWKFVVALGN